MDCWPLGLAVPSSTLLCGGDVAKVSKSTTNNGRQREHELCTRSSVAMPQPREDSGTLPEGEEAPWGAEKTDVPCEAYTCHPSTRGGGRKIEFETDRSLQSKSEVSVDSQ